MKISWRGWIVIGLFGTVLAALFVYLRPELTAAEKGRNPEARSVATRTPEYRLRRAWLGQLLRAAGTTPQQVDNRYDFTFRSAYDGADWNLTMTAILSNDGEWVWLMAWLDELPRQSSEVPRTALLRLLALNDQLGAGKFFAYIPSSRRFVMEQAVPTRGLDAKRLRAALTDLGASVAKTYNQWTVANWQNLAAPASIRPADLGTPRSATVVSQELAEPRRPAGLERPAEISARGIPASPDAQTPGRARLSSRRTSQTAPSGRRMLQWTPFPRP